MTWQTNPAVIAVRHFARRAGLIRALQSLRLDRRYESAFDAALFAILQPGDIVWDVGANVGYYTKRFAQAVGPSGRVVAFEPFPSTAERLRENLQGLSNCALEVLALGADAGRTTMQTGTDELGATSRIIEAPQPGGVEVEIQTGDAIVYARRVAPPIVVKIDTEGFELDVLRGMPKLIVTPSLRALFIEVHFGLLAERGMPRAPVEIERLLRNGGFQTRWVDPSHIEAVRV